MRQHETVANIGPGEQQRRRIIGLFALGLGMIAGIVMLVFGVPRLWRLPLFLLFFPAAAGLYQAQEKT